MKKQGWIALLVVVIALVSGKTLSFRDVAFVTQVLFPETPSTSSTNADWHIVKRVVDGDTFELENGEKVRYIGINAPESVKPNSPVECFGHEASVYDTQLVEGKRVRLEKDVSDRDKYGRLLRFVYLEDGTFVNDKLVREGYASADTFPPDVAQAAVFKQAQAEARAAERGLWSPTTCHGKK